MLFSEPSVRYIHNAFAIISDYDSYLLVNMCVCVWVHFVCSTMGAGDIGFRGRFYDQNSGAANAIQQKLLLEIRTYLVSVKVPTRSLMLCLTIWYDGRTSCDARDVDFLSLVL